MKLQTPIAILAIGLLFSSCNNEEATNGDATAKPVITTQEISYKTDTVTMNGFMAYDSAKEGKRPAVLIVHEWWGQTDYPRERARQLAELGYVAFAVDMYGNGKTVDNPTDAGAMSGPFYNNAEMSMSRFNAALEKVKTLEQVDTSKIAAIGYCFGGSMVLMAANSGADLDGVVSFHGILPTGPFDKEKLKADVLICHGAADPFVPQEQVDGFRKAMDSIGAKYTFKAYPDAVHAFSNPQATEIGEKFNIPIKYNATADSASWKEMREFFGRIF